MEPLCAAARFSRAVQAVTFCTFRRLRPLCRLHRLDEAVLWLLPYLFFVLAALHGAARAKRLLCVFGCALLPPAGLTAPCLSSDAFGHSPLLLAVPYFFLLFAMTAFSPDKAAGAARGGLGGGCERAAGLSEIPAPRRRGHRFRRGVGYGAAAYVFAAACTRRRTALDFMSGGVRLRTVRRRGAARRRTMI